MATRVTIRAFGGALLSSLVFLASCAAPAVTDESPPAGGESVASRSDAIVNGKLDTTHQAVMLESCTTKCICTGTLVKKDETTGVGWVVTAGHCMAEPGQEPALRFYVQGDKAATYSADFENTLEVGAIRYPVLDWVRSPKYTAGNGISGPSNDIGIVRVLGVGPETPVIPLSPAEDELVAKMDAVDVGYGSSGPFNDAKNLGIAGTRQRADVKIKAVETANVVVDANDPGGSINSGDSGGPLLAMVDGVESVVGIHSTRSSFLGGNKQNNTRVSKQRSWLDEELAKTPKLDTCNTCLRNATGGVKACAKTSLACLDDADCNDFAICVDACASVGDVGPTKACRDKCATDHPKAPAVYEPAIACGCQTCGSLCGTTCEGLPPPPSGTAGQSDAGASTPGTGTAPGAPSTGDSGADVEDVPAKDSGCATAPNGNAPRSGGAVIAAIAIGLAFRRRRAARA